MKIKSYPAGLGESFLISINLKSKKFNMLIDVGYLSTAKLIVQDLIELKSSGQILDLMVLTHIDNDHINGTRYILDKIINHNLIELKEIWYNNYFMIANIMTDMTENSIILNCKKDIEILRNIINTPYPRTNEIIYNQKDVGFQSASYIDEFLYLDEIKQKHNKSFENKCILLNDKNNSVQLNDDIRIIILGPVFDNLKNQYNTWQNYLMSKGFSKSFVNSNILSQAFEANMLTEKLNPNIEIKNCCGLNFDILENKDFDYDTSINNRTSISLIIEVGDKKIAFLGDSSPLDLESSIDKYLCDYDKKIVFDLVKIPHHGSKYNWSNLLTQKFTSKNYIIATNGDKYGHPDIETFFKIISASNSNVKIYMNYKPKWLNLLKNQEVLEKYKYEVIYENVDHTKKVVQEITI